MTTKSPRLDRLALALAAMLAVSAIAVLPGSPASATNFGSTGTPGAEGTNNGVWLTNDAFYNIGRMSMDAANSTAVGNSITGDYNPTDLDAAALTGNCNDPAYNACVFDSAYGNNNLAGWNACAGTTSGSHPNQTCSLAYIRFNQTYTWSPDALACHEIGHSVGLRHSTQAGSCMVNPLSGSNLTSHDRAHINAAY